MDPRTYSAVPWHDTAYIARNIGLPRVQRRTLQHEVYPETPPGLPGFFALRRCNTYVQECDWWRIEAKGSTKGRKEGTSREEERGLKEEKGKEKKKKAGKKSRKKTAILPVACPPSSLCRMVLVCG